MDKAQVKELLKKITNLEEESLQDVTDNISAIDDYVDDGEPVEDHLGEDMDDAMSDLADSLKSLSDQCLALRDEINSKL